MTNNGAPTPSRQTPSRQTTARPVTPFPVTPLARQIFAIASANDTKAMIVGGAVRDWLLGRAIGDIDMAIAMPIAAAANAFRAAGLRVIETGLSHGTVTVLASPDSSSDSAPHPSAAHSIEVTQTRRDVETDGRHAVVAYSDDWAADAARRDFTINAIYLDSDGQIEDPLGGQADIASGRLRFVGTAAARVSEDALRMLRYCRFLPLFTTSGTDADAVTALRDQAGLAGTLSGERIQYELAQICGAPGSQVALSLMQDTGLAVAAIGYELSPERLSVLPSFAALHQSIKAPADQVHLWLLILAILIPDGAASAIADRLRLSRKQTRWLTGLEAATKLSAKSDTGSDTSSDTGSDGNAESRFGLFSDQWQQSAWFLRRDGLDPAFVYAHGAARQMRPIDAGHMAVLSGWVPPICPLSGADLLSQGVDKGPALGQMLATAERRWVDSGFVLSKADLLSGLLSGQLPGGH